MEPVTFSKALLASTLLVAFSIKVGPNKFVSLLALTQTEIEKMVTKGAIVPVAPCKGQFLSQLFLVLKKDGSARPVVNLKALNKFITRKKFKMEGARLLRDLLRPGDWMASIDLKDAYFSVTMAQQDRKLLWFSWQGQIYEFQCLPFGLSSAP